MHDAFETFWSYQLGLVKLRAGMHAFEILWCYQPGLV
jgi:hypothetical protein